MACHAGASILLSIATEDGLAEVEKLFLLFLAEFLETRIGAQRTTSGLGKPRVSSFSSVRISSLTGCTRIGL